MKGRNTILGSVMASGLLAGLVSGAAAQGGAAAPVEFSAVIVGGPDLRSPTCEVVADLTQCTGQAWSPYIYVSGDPRLAGQMTVTENRIEYPDPDPWLVTETYRIVNDDGAWQGSYTDIIDDVETDYTYGNASLVLVGEGAYEGLYAWMDTSDWDAIKGFVFSAPPPEAPVPPSVE